MHVFRIDDPNEGLLRVLSALRQAGITCPSRNGPVIRFPTPVCLEYSDPRKRLITLPLRNANPFFHLFETMWMLGGLRELKPLLLFNKDMAQYSDDGKMLRGTAYGHRWRKQWGDQLDSVKKRFQASTDDRRAVVSMWDPKEAFQMQGKDFACNLQIIFSTRPSDTTTGRSHILDMTVMNRSNDLIYGAMGSNIFHFSMLHEYMAMHCELDLGTYYQISTNLHLYLENPIARKVWQGFDSVDQTGMISAPSDTTLSDLGLTFDHEQIARYVLNHDSDLKDSYLIEVVRPMVEAYKIYKLKTRLGIEVDAEKRIDLAVDLLSRTASSFPLHAAGISWFNRSPARKASQHG